MGAHNVELALRSRAAALHYFEPVQAGVDSERHELQNMARDQLAPSWLFVLVDRRPRHRGADCSTTTADLSAHYLVGDDNGRSIMWVLCCRRCLHASVLGTRRRLSHEAVRRCIRDVGGAGRSDRRCTCDAVATAKASEPQRPHRSLSRAERWVAFSAN